MFDGRQLEEAGDIEGRPEPANSSADYHCPVCTVSQCISLCLAVLLPTHKTGWRLVEPPWSRWRCYQLAEDDGDKGSREMKWIYRGCRRLERTVCWSLDRWYSHWTSTWASSALVVKSQWLVCLQYCTRRMSCSSLVEMWTQRQRSGFTSYCETSWVLLMMPVDGYPAMTAGEYHCWRRHCCSPDVDSLPHVNYVMSVISLHCFTSFFIFSCRLLTY